MQHKRKEYLTLFGKKKTDMDIVVLNSVALKSQAIEFIRAKGYQKVCIYFNNDQAGPKALKKFQEILKHRADVVSLNHHYQAYKDLNKYLLKKSLSKS
jgi:hypothetical protein